MGRTGYVNGTLAVREGLRAPVPAVDPRPIMTRADVGHGGIGGGHDMASMSGASMAGMDHGATTAKPAAQDMSGMDHSGQDMSAMQGGASMAGMDHGAGGMQAHPAGEAGNPLVDMQTMTPVDRKSTRLNSSH